VILNVVVSAEEDGDFSVVAVGADSTHMMMTEVDEAAAAQQSRPAAKMPRGDNGRISKICVDGWMGGYPRVYTLGWNALK